MDKTKEKEIFNAVFLNRFNQPIMESEAPDFVIKDQTTGKKLGVEVTEVYSDETDARLTHHKGYRSKLLNKEMEPFKADQENISVVDAKIIGKDGALKDEVTAIKIDSISINTAVDKVESTIKIKNKKCVSYLNNCDQVDLVINDSSNMFLLDSFLEFHKFFFGLINNKHIYQSKFREIYLIFNLSSNERLYVPLKISAFLSDFFTINENFSKKWADELKDNEVIWKMQFASMFFQSNANYSVTIESSFIRLHYGAWVIEISEEGNKVKDYSNVFDKKDEVQTISEIISDLNTQSIDIAKNWADLPRDSKIAIPIHFPVNKETM